MHEARQGTALQTIFGIFLGLMVTAFIGVGAYTFYPSPQEQHQRRRVELERQEQAIRNAKAPEDLTPADRTNLQAIQTERNREQDASQLAFKAWGRTTSIVLVVFATLTMAVSLVRADRLPVISNGLLMGGVFTMLYGVGWIIVTDASTTRFVVMSVALVITLALGYLRFVRGQTTSTARAAPVAGPEGLAHLEARVHRVEQRLDAAATALGGAAVGQDSRP